MNYFILEILKNLKSIENINDSQRAGSLPCPTESRWCTARKNRMCRKKWYPNQWRGGLAWSFLARAWVDRMSQTSQRIPTRFSTPPSHSSPVGSSARALPWSSAMPFIFSYNLSNDTKLFFLLRIYIMSPRFALFFKKNIQKNFNN